MKTLREEILGDLKSMYQVAHWLVSTFFLAAGIVLFGVLPALPENAVLDLSMLLMSIYFSILLVGATINLARHLQSHWIAYKALKAMSEETAE